ncbi:Outer membrane protein TolC [Chitinophaga jiangningensis]|uniref:Outer membrane protein TolC n=1 Tax=Chitinophaga jiangningensis TaxID=1419482 RepID=A0A1M6Z3R0_9BACT|nr:TolC family protein [Chitinophaga jiangningensis]SHL25138.1 Outer membrane protein TolC [Chitinophaga jiangningensis]
MNHRQGIIATGLLLAIHSSHIYAQATTVNDTLKITLPEAWQKAEAYSRAIAIRKKSTAIAAEEIEDRKKERLPELDVAGSAEKATNIPIYGDGVFTKPTSQHEVIHTLYKVGADMYFNIYNGNKLNLRLQADKVLHQMATIREEETTSEIRYKTAAHYLELQQALIFRDLIKSDIADQEKQLQEIKTFYKNGTVLKSDVLRVELDLSKRQLTLVKIENDILVATQKLNIILGEEDERPVTPAALEMPETGIDYTHCLQEAMAHSYQYHLSENQTALSKINLRQVKANVRPKAGLYGDFYYANPQIFLYPYNPSWYSLGIAGVKVSFPLSSLYHNTHKVSAAKIELDKEEEAHKDTEDQVRQQVKEAFLRYKESLVQIDVAQTNVTRAQANARIIKSAYFHQASLVTDLLDADVQLLETRFELAAARIIAQNKYYLLRHITGTL